MKGRVHKKEETIENPELLDQLTQAVLELEAKMRATIPITRGGANTIGFGVNKAQRGIAADSVISIAKAIKALKGW